MFNVSVESENKHGINQGGHGKLSAIDGPINQNFNFDVPHPQGDIDNAQCKIENLSCG